MRRQERRRTIPTAKVLRALILFFPLGLYYMWKRQCRWSIPVKAFTSVVTILCTIGLFMGTLTFLPSQDAMQRAQADVVQKRWQGEYPLMADLEHACYHVEGCVHVKEDAVSVTLDEAFQLRLSPDHACNPPTYQARN